MVATAFAFVGLLNYTDDVAMASAPGGIVCASDGDCTLRVPPEGRVLSMASGGAVRDFGVSGGELHVVCPPGSPPVDLDGVSGSVSVRGCRVGVCRGISGQLTVDWDGSVECTDFSGTVTSTGESEGTFSGSGILNSGGGGATTVGGGEWTIRGSGPVNFTAAADFEFDSGTAGIESVDWGWLSRPSVTVSEFANPLPVTHFVDQTIEVIGGWPDGSTLKGCVASGSFGHVPLISGSTVRVSDHAFGPVVERIERSSIYGNVRSEGPADPILLNEVDGEISVATQTTFVNSATGYQGSLNIEGPHCVLCPECGWTEFYDGASNATSTDLYIRGDAQPASLDLGGHHAVLDLGPSARTRRDDFSTNGTMQGENTYIGGTVTIIDKGLFEYYAEVTSNITFHAVTLILGTKKIIIEPHCSVTAISSTIQGGGFDEIEPGLYIGIEAFSSTTALSLYGCTIEGYIKIDVGSVRLYDCDFEDFGGVGTENILSSPDWCVCGLGQTGTGEVSQFVYNWGTNPATTTINNTCDSVCVYSGAKPDDCDGHNKLAAGSNYTCPFITTAASTTPTTAPTTAPTASTTTVYVPPEASSGSSSDDDEAIMIIAAVAGGTIAVLALTASFTMCFGNRDPGG